MFKGEAAMGRWREPDDDREQTGLRVAGSLRRRHGAAAREAPLLLLPLLLLVASLGSRSGMAATNYTVGDEYGWRRPPAGNPNFYADWAAKYEFYDDDTLLFNSSGGASNLLLLSQAKYEMCNTQDPGGNNTYKTPVRVYFEDAGTYFFSSSVPGDCAAGVKLQATILKSAGKHGWAGGPAPAPPAGGPVTLPPPPPSAADGTPTQQPPGRDPPLPPPPPSTEVPTSSSPPPNNVFAVGGAGHRWEQPQLLSFYNDWAATVAPLYVDTDLLSFTYDPAMHDVAVVSKPDYDTCNTSAADPSNVFATGNDLLHPTVPGFYFFTSRGPGDCQAGMRFGVQYLAGARPAARAPAAGGGGGPGPAAGGPTPTPAAAPPAGPTPEPAPAALMSPAPAGQSPPPPPVVGMPPMLPPPPARRSVPPVVAAAAPGPERSWASAGGPTAVVPAGLAGVLVLMMLCWV